MITSPITHTNVATHLTITYDDEYVETIKSEDYFLPVFNRLFVDKSIVNTYIDELHEQFYQAPKDAMVNDTGEIIQEQPGQSLDREKFMRLLIPALYQKKQEPIEIPMRGIYPRVTSELLSEISTHKIGEYETSFNQDNKERSQNITIAAASIDNIVVFPSEKFSFNTIVGERTKEKGYMKAPVIVKGELDEDIGGGICQVSSTLFNAVSLRGIQIIERYSHSREVPYVPPGKDAAVSWWGPDFTFKNKYRQPILIRATAKQGKMLVQIYSSEEVYKEKK